MVVGTSGLRESARLALAKPRFEAPVPGKGGATADSLKGQTVVISGIFPELGGGAGLTLGQGRVAAIVKQFGGTVRHSVSGKTTMLIVGKNPGYKKVVAARHNAEIHAGKIKLVTLPALKKGLELGGKFTGLNGVEGTKALKAGGGGQQGGKVVVSDERLTIPRYSAGFVTKRGGNTASKAGAKAKVETAAPVDVKKVLLAEKLKATAVRFQGPPKKRPRKA
jgi:hypothetical protein